MGKRYGGATSREEAVDFLVAKQIQGAAYTRYQYKADDSYTIQKMKSCIYKDIVGTLESGTLVSNETKIKTTNKGVYFNVDKDKKGDKVYFLSTGSKIKENINLSDSTNTAADKIKDILKSRNLLKINNIVLNIKQGETFDGN